MNAESAVLQVRIWYWSCPACALARQECAQDDARKLADEHDKATHKGKPMTVFGWGLK